MSEVFDLFGNPVEAGTGKPGRPRKDATPEDRNKVKMLLAVGWSNERIAGVLHMSLPTFRRNFLQELKFRGVARDMLDARRFELAMTSALAGNVGAMRQVDRLLEMFDRMQAERAFGGKAKDQPEKVGKKLTAEALALDADAELQKELEMETRDNVRH